MNVTQEHHGVKRINNCKKVTKWLIFYLNYSIYFQCYDQGKIEIICEDVWLQHEHLQINLLRMSLEIVNRFIFKIQSYVQR
jgi:hypothetical protein